MSANKTTVDLDLVKKVLASEFDLKPRLVPGTRSFYRYWQTVEIFDPFGAVLHRFQWRGDLSRTVEDDLKESISWHSVGSRFWNPAASRYEPYRELDYARGFSYKLSIEDEYDDLNWDYSSVPKSIEGSTFRQAFTVTAHFEFDFLRSVKHGAIQKLTRIGDLLSESPEEGQTFSLSFPPVVTNSILKREKVHVGFLGLNHFEGEPCALLQFRQGPQKFSWDGIEGPDVTAVGQYEDNVWHKELTSWQFGQLALRLSDGGLAEGELLENHMIKRSNPAGDEVMPINSRGIWTIRQISEAEYSSGLEGWNDDQSELPWHCFYSDFRSR